MSDVNFSVEVSIPGDLAGARRLQAEIEQALQASQYTETDVFRIRLAVEEALVNAIKHGNQLDPDKRVLVHYEITSDRLHVRITGEGQGFNPEDAPGS